MVAMRAVLLLSAILLHLSGIKAGWDSSCEVEGADRYDWLGYFSLDTTINDDHEGITGIFKTKNIVALKGQSSRYLNATFQDEILTVFTNENFTRFEEEYPEHKSSVISLKLDFECKGNKSETLDMRQTVKDVNNHDPVLSQQVFEYNFGLRVPQDYLLTKFLPISGSDVDFTNRYMYFSLEFNEYVKLQYKTEQDYYDRTDYLPTLTTLKEIRGPFRQEFTMVVKDGASPARNTTALLRISVTSNDTDGGDGNGNSPHPPVFSEHLYFAHYTSDNELKMEQAITIKYGAETNTIVKQSGYEDYFKIALDAKSPSILQVTQIRPLPTEILEATELVVIEIEALNEGLHIPGRTTLIIRLPKQDDLQDRANRDSAKDCSINHVFLFSDTSSALSLTIYLCAISVAVLTNIGVLVWYFWKRSLIPRAQNQPYVVSELPPLEVPPKE